MANPEQLELLKQNIKAWHQWRKNAPEVYVDLENADLRNANLTDANLSYANLRGANLTPTDLTRMFRTPTNLTRANLTAADLTRADLESADLRHAILTHANLTHANLTRADLDSTNLIRANFRSANLTHADLESADLTHANLESANLTNTNLVNTNFTYARAGWTLFSNTNLSLALGLDTVTHQGPSSIGADTIYESSGKISHAFLRGAGVPDNFIEYMSSLTGAGIEFYSCFISYSTQDQEFADRLYADLQNKGVRCWFAPHDVAAGRKLHEQIDEAIRVHDKLLLILSPASMKSQWVKTEIAKARKREVRDEKRVLFPLKLTTFESLRDWECFDADTGKDSAREIREYFIPDFSNWKTDRDGYEKAFERLLRDLKSTETKPK